MAAGALLAGTTASVGILGLKGMFNNNHEPPKNHKEKQVIWPFGHLKTRSFTIKTSENVGFWWPMEFTLASGCRAGDDKYFPKHFFHFHDAAPGCARSGHAKVATSFTR